MAIDTIDAPGKQGVAARHALRIALRRLRVALETYAAVLQDTVPPRLSRRTRSLARRVGVLRTRDVHVRLLSTVAKGRSAGQRASLRKLKADDTHQPSEHEIATIRARWQRLAAELEPSLEAWTERHAVGTVRPVEPLAVVAADALEQAVERITSRCGAIGSIDDFDAMHAARLAIKAARYIMMPLLDHSEEHDATVEALRSAQVEFGKLNDARLLRDELQRGATGAKRTGKRARTTAAALAASDMELADRISSAFDALAQWRDAAALQQLLQPLRTIACAWRGAAGPPMEIERKWLLSSLPLRVDGIVPDTLAQGYLPGDTLVERIRSITRAGATRWIRTVKIGRGLVRVEIEEETTVEIATALFALTAGKRVTKLRYAVPDQALTWEIDDFTDRALVLAEVELPTADTAVEIPRWLAPYIVREVTDEKAFTNWQLAR